MCWGSQLCLFTIVSLLFSTGFPSLQSASNINNLVFARHELLPGQFCPDISLKRAMPTFVNRLLFWCLAETSSILASDDEVSLIQDMKSMLSLQRPDHTTVANLMESATTMLKNGATNDVVLFVNATLTEVTGTVVPAIEHASRVSQENLYTSHKEFFATLKNLNAGLSSIADLESDETSKSQAHIKCRKEEEAPKCKTKTDCDKSLYEYWDTWYKHELDLHRDHLTFHGHFCVENGTHIDIRSTSASYMTDWMVTEERVRSAASKYTKQVELCNTAYTELSKQNEACNIMQTALEKAACAHAEKVSETVINFHTDFVKNVAAYETLVNHTKHMQADRIKEYTTLEVVQCLLHRVTERNGAPCDETTDTLEKELTECRERRHVVDSTHLNLTYPCIPPIPVACSSRDSLSNCMPIVQPHPCGTSFITQEYAELPALPEAPFGMQDAALRGDVWRETSCHGRPDCAVCNSDIHDCAEECKQGEAECGACWSHLAVSEYCTSNPHASGCPAITDSDEFKPAGVCNTICQESYEFLDEYLNHQVTVDDVSTTVRAVVDVWCPPDNENLQD